MERLIKPPTVLEQIYRIHVPDLTVRESGSNEEEIERPVGGDEEGGRRNEKACFLLSG